LLSAFRLLQFPLDAQEPRVTRAIESGITNQWRGGRLRDSKYRLGSDRGGGVPFMIEGTTSDPKFVPDIKGMAGSAVQQAGSGTLAGAKVG
jgi:hypothetical protein